MNDMQRDILEVKTRLAADEAITLEHHRDLNGNGKPGLKTDVADLKKEVAVINAKIALYSALGSVIGSGIMALIIRRIGG